MTDHRKTAAAFVDKHLLGREEFFDSAPELPLAVYRDLQAAGLATWWLGSDGEPAMSLEDGVDVVEELAYGDAGVAFSAFVTILVTTPVYLYGSDTQRAAIGAMCERGGVAATLGSERAAGSELFRISTTARRHGDRIHLDGQKLFSTNAGFADLMMVIASAPDEPQRYVAALIPARTRGVKIVQRWDLVGVRAAGTYEVELAGCDVPADSLLQISGIKALEIGLNPSRILIAATGVGIGRRMLDLCLEYAGGKELKGGVLRDNHVFAAKIGQMEMELTAMHTACKAAARDFDALMRSPDPAAAFEQAGALKSALVAKMLCGQLGWKIASVASEMFGGLGFTRQMLVHKLVRDMRYISILEGGDDVLRDLLYARYVRPRGRG